MRNGSSAVAPLQAGSVAVTHAHRSVRAKACHCLAHELWGGMEGTLRQRGFVSFSPFHKTANEIWSFMYFMCVAATLNWCWCYISFFNKWINGKQFASCKFFCFLTLKILVQRLLQTHHTEHYWWTNESNHQRIKTGPKVHMLLSVLWQFLWIPVAS